MFCISGPDGSGKSTQIKLTQEYLQKRGVSVKVVSIWHILTDKKFQNLVGFSGKGQVDDFLQALSGDSRILFLFHCYQQALSDASKEKFDVLLHDAYWYKYYATEASYGLNATTYKSLAEAIFPAPDACVYIDLAPEICAERKDRFSKYECGFAMQDKKKEFVRFQSLSQNVQKDMARNYGWHLIDGTKSREAIHEEIITLLDQML